MKTDYLALLLSTDWFIEFWPEFGFRFTDESRRNIQAGCREIVRKFMAGAGDYYQIDLSDERHRETYLMLVGLIEAHASGRDNRKVVDEWINGPGDDLRSAITLRMLTNDLLLEAFEESMPGPDYEARRVVKEEAKIGSVSADRIQNTSILLQSAWDLHVQELFGETPSALFDIASFAVQERRLKDLWKAICKRLTERQVDSLIAWCRSTATLREIPIDPIPNYLTCGSPTNFPQH